MPVKKSDQSCIMGCPFKPKVGRPKSAQKRLQILDAAARLFLLQGFSNTSMDTVAGEAGVSKQTVYSHFQNKEELYTAVIHHKVEQYQLDGSQFQQQPHSAADMLGCIGSQFVQLLQDEQVIAMYRVVIGEAQNAPKVAALFYQAGPKHGLHMLSQQLQQRSEWSLSETQSEHYAMLFFNMLKGEFHMQSLLGLDFQLSAEEQRSSVDCAVEHLLVLLDKHQASL